MAAWYSHLDDGRVYLLHGADTRQIAASLDPLPDAAPAVAMIGLTEVNSQSNVVAIVLDSLETAVRQAFPSWLPGGEDLDGPNRLDLLAARGLALGLASTTDHFGPYVASMSESALLGRPSGGRFIDQTRAEGARRLLADTYRRRSVALVISVDGVLTPQQQAQLAGGCVWLANRGGFAVWIVGQDAFASDLVRVVDVSISADATTNSPGFDDTGVHIPAIAGQPHPGSAAEKKLERALASCAWATGREWNQEFQPTPLHKKIKVDLRWPAEKCTIEVDGSEHRHHVKFANDHQRDVELQLAGYAVLRFTNGQIFDDVTAVVSAIEKYIKNKRDLLSRTARIEGNPRGE